MNKGLVILAHVLAVVGVFTFTTAAAQAPAYQPSGGMDGRTIIAVLSTMLSLAVGLYARSFEAKTDGKADKDMVKEMFNNTKQIMELFVEQQRNNTVKINDHSRLLHQLELALAQHHPTKQDLKEAIDLSLRPVVRQLEQLSSKIDKLSEEQDDD